MLNLLAMNSAGRVFRLCRRGVFESFEPLGREPEGWQPVNAESMTPQQIKLSYPGWAIDCWEWSDIELHDDAWPNDDTEDTRLDQFRPDPRD